MWSYYGAKTNIVDHYPAPREDKIIEPFAGTARYSLKYYDRDILLVDKYDVIIKIWKWLQQCSPSDILNLPRFKTGDNINDHNYNCIEERYLMGFLVGFGATAPRNIVTPRLTIRPNHINYGLEKIASNLFKIKYWKFINGEYIDIANNTATWFIDPPYQFGGHSYKHSNKKIDYEHLARWSMERKGQVMVCENTKADWMNFQQIAVQKTLSGKNGESMWSN